MSDEDDPATFNVTSNHQSGGITAGQININPPQRQLTEPLKTELLKLLETVSFKSIMIYSVAANNEAHQYAEQICKFLKSQNFDMQGHGTAMLFGKVEPIKLVLPNDEGTVVIQVGPQ